MDRKLLLCAFAHHQSVLDVVQYIIQRRMLARRRLWVRRWISRREQFGMYDHKKCSPLSFKSIAGVQESMPDPLFTSVYIPENQLVHHIVAHNYLH